MPRKKKQEESAAIAGPEKGDFIAPPPTDDEDLEQDVEATLPQQEEFWRPPVRFGSVPVEKEPLGWDRRKAFRKLFPRVALPFQVVERVAFGHPDLEPNRLFWGDNLHVMRQLPSESIDLIYIDPPFFSGRQYNVIFGDQNELRSFSDIWEGGMPGYLIWLNARLFEMKRLLKKTGSIYVHLDWHASHYVKVEMDRIFGHGNFNNEIVWYYYNKMAPFSRCFPRAHDSIIGYVKNRDAVFTFHKQEEKRDQPVKQLKRRFINGKPINVRNESGEVQYQVKDTRRIDDVWKISCLQPADKTERLGYPTQKPESLLERIILASSNEGDIVADFYCGGGTTPAVAQRLGRRWIACDQSRVAVAITADRLTRLVEEQIGRLFPVPDFTIEHWGVYEAKQLSETPPDQFRAFVLKCYGAVEQTSPRSRGERGGAQASHTAIHGYKGAIPIWVGEPSPRKAVSAKDVEEFANALRKTLRYQQDNLREGTMLAWAFRQDALDAADRLRRSERTDLNFVRLDMIRIDSPQFRQHVATLSTTHADYENFLTFVQPPRIEVLYKRIAPLTWSFDVSDTVILNPGAKIINVQWDFDYGKRFSSTPGYSFVRGSKKEPQLRAQYKFPSSGKKRVACKVQDDMGGEGLWSAEIEVE
jgi:DNA modification methylase